MLTRMLNKNRIFITALAVLLVAPIVNAQTPEFTYQGRLTDGGNPASATYDMQFKLFDTLDVGTGTQKGPTRVNLVQVTNGVFTVQLDFGQNQFNGSPRYLEIGIRPPGSPDPYTVLAPRQPITSTPYAIRSLAANGLSAACVNCVTSNQIQDVQGAQVTGEIPVASIPAGSGNYIQNAAAGLSAGKLVVTQVGGFTLTGDGTLGGTLSGNVVNAVTQYNIGGNRVLSNAGTRNSFAGVGAGQANTLGTDNAFFGFNAGFNNTGNLTIGGRFNSFFGTSAGQLLTQGRSNSFFGASAGSASTAGNNNSFFGAGAGSGNAGDDNSFFGASAGIINKGNRNSFFGVSAGRQSFFGDPDPTATGDDNSFFGNGAGAHNTASGNAFFGSLAGNANTIGARNSFFGASAGFNTVGADLQGQGADNSFFGYQAGKGNVNGRTSAFFGSNAGLISDGVQNSFFGANAGKNDYFTFNNTFIGYNTGISNVSGTGITLIGSNANVQFADLANATAIGANALVAFSNSLVLGDNSVRVIVPGSMEVSGTIKLASLGSAGSFFLCRNSASLPSEISFCSSSLRYKTDVQPFSTGLALVRRLHPISFTWKSDHTRDLGLGAEDVAAVEPLLTFRNDKGEIEGVKYDRLSAVLINAVKEQQQQIERQQQQLQEHQAVIDGLRKLLCQNNPQAEICKGSATK